MIQFFSYIYFLLPKIDIIQFSFTPTGIRAQDFCILIMTLLLPFRYKSKLLKIIILLFLVSIPSFFVGSSYVGTTKVLVGYLRLNEYACLAFCLLYLFDQNKLQKLLLNCLLIHMFIAIFQYLLLVPLIDPGRGVYYSPQFAGLMGNAAELTYFFIAILPIIQLKNHRIILPLKFAILLNQVKGGALGLIVNVKLRILIVLMLFLLLIDYFFLSLLIELYSFVKFMLLLELQDIPFEAIKGAEGLDKYAGEASLAQRVYKWWNALGFLAHNVSALMFGVGYGVLPGAMDGGLIKLLLEVGIFYFVILLMIYIRIGFSIFLIFVCTNFLFDGYTSSVVAPFLLMYLLMPNKEKLNR